MKAGALLAALMLGGCAASATPAAAPRERPAIVSLNPCTDAILADVADRAQILAISHYSQDPRSTSMDLATARSLRATGGSAEEVLALHPDLVLASSFTAPSTLAAYRRLGLRVETFGISSTVEESEEQVRRIAALVGHSARGDELARRIATATKPVGGKPITAALWQPGGIVPGAGTLVSDLLSRAGFTSYSAERGMGQGAYLSLEQVVARPPQLLLVAGSERGQHHPVLRHLTHTTIAPFAPNLLYCGGPTIIRAMDRLRALRKKVGRSQAAVS
ncbi:MAG: ABC transporter substrate-binding protein [Sphingomonadaceae bacterium]